MCGWLKQTAKLLQPLYDLMRRRVLQSRVIHTDDTKVRNRSVKHIFPPLLA